MQIQIQQNIIIMILKGTFQREFRKNVICTKYKCKKIMRGINADMFSDLLDTEKDLINYRN